MKTTFCLRQAAQRLFLQILLPAFCACTGLHAQTNYWTWINGSNTLNVLGVYGTLGAAAAANQPGGRYDPGYWTDASGNLWMFGGWGYAATNTTTAGNGGAGFLNDLWKYTISTNEWTWMGGSNAAGAADVYGTENVAAAGNVPGARYGPATWADASGNLWLFGGASGTGLAAITNHYDDLWKYNIASGEWTWVGGTQNNNVVGTYGTEGVASTANLPGGRYNMATWVDASGNFWLFGGGGMPATSVGTNPYGYLNDLWKYTPTTGTWTFVSGGEGVQTAGTYGTKGTAAAANTPGGRYAATGVLDAGGNNLWLFGGAAGPNESSETYFYEDLWNFNISTSQWTWVAGDNATGESGVYGTKGTAAAANHPGGRAAPANWAKVIGGTILIFGGAGYDGAGNLGELGDLWAYNIGPGQWTWMGGSNTYDVDGTYGTKGTAAAANTPGARYSMGSWVDTKSNLWLFGGHGYPATGTTLGFLQDLWELQPLGILNVSWISFTATASGRQVLLNWQTAQEPEGAYFNIQRSADGINWQTIGSVNALGGSAGAGNYLFTDQQPLLGMNYYRLQLTDSGDQSQYSTVVAAEYQSGPSLICYAISDRTLQAILQNGANEPYRLLDISGREVAQGALQNGQVTLGPLVHGTYILLVMARTGMIIRKTVL